MDRKQKLEITLMPAKTRLVKDVQETSQVKHRCSVTVSNVSFLAGQQWKETKENIQKGRLSCLEKLKTLFMLHCLFKHSKQSYVHTEFHSKEAKNPTPSLFFFNLIGLGFLRSRVQRNNSYDLSSLPSPKNRSKKSACSVLQSCSKWF